MTFLLQKFEDHKASDAFVWADQAYAYEWLSRTIDAYRTQLEDSLPEGCVAMLTADFSPHSVALLLACFERNRIVVPTLQSNAARAAEFAETAQAQVALTVDARGAVHHQTLTHSGLHPLYDELRKRRHPGVVYFSSGSTGRMKAAVHDVVPLLEKFKVTRRAFRTIAFLLFDHLGGLNTILHTLSNGGCVVTVDDRRPDAVLKAVQDHRVELLPTSPTFLNLMLVSEAYRRYDLSSLKVVTYGTEPMLESTLHRATQVIPHARFQQTYGLSELGVLRSQSRSSDSLWVRLGGEGFEMRVVDGILHIRSASAMLGYLNAPSPFTEDGWFNTQDSVEVDGEYVRILGRVSQIINVGGEKVYPAEVESVIHEVPGVAEVIVYGAPNNLLGQIVCATVSTEDVSLASEFALRVRKHCAGRLARYKVPVRVSVTNEDQHTERMKKRIQPFVGS